METDNPIAVAERLQQAQTQREIAKNLAQVSEELKKLTAVVQALNESVKTITGAVAAGNQRR